MALPFSTSGLTFNMVPAAKAADPDSIKALRVERVSSIFLEPRPLRRLLDGRAARGSAIRSALPRQWQEGHVDGLRARGGLKVGLTWRHGTLTEVRLQSMTRTAVRVRYRTESIVVALEPGKLLKLDASRLLPLESMKAGPSVH